MALPWLTRASILFKQNKFITIHDAHCSHPNISNQIRCSSRKAKREKRAEKRRDRLLVKQANPWIPQSAIMQKQKEIKLAKDHLMKKDVIKWPLIPEKPVDDVYLMSLYPPQKYSIHDAVPILKQLSDKTMFDCEDSFIHLLLDLNMKLDTKAKYLDKFRSFIRVPHYYDEGESRRIIALTKDSESAEEAVKAGAFLSGGMEIIDQLADGSITREDFDYLVATPDVMPDVLLIKKLLKGNFPSVRAGSITTDLANAVDKFYNIKYYSVFRPLEEEHNWGQCKICIGKLDLELPEIEENITAFVKSLCTHRPARLGPFITDAMLIVEETKEEIHIDISSCLQSKVEKVTDEGAQMENEK